MNHLPPFHQSVKLGLGCSTFGGSKSKKTALRTLANCYDHGVNYFDLARSYGYGQAEAIVGSFVRDKRDKVFITTKFGIAPPRPFPMMEQAKNIVRRFRQLAPGLTSRAINYYSVTNVSRPPVTPQAAITSLETSLREMKTDYVDFFLLHDCHYKDALRDDIGEVMEMARTAGKLRSWGASCEDKVYLSSYFRTENPVEVLQFPYRAESNFIGKSTGKKELTKVIFSVMSQYHDTKLPSKQFFEHLPVNRIAPGTVRNLAEAWLYVACQELDAGVILCSMTQEEHIRRNIRIVQAPAVSTSNLAIMKRALTSGFMALPPGLLNPSNAQEQRPARVA